MENINDYKFDFAAEAENLINGLGEKAGNFLFVNVSTNKDTTPPKVTFQAVLGGEKVTEEAMMNVCRKVQGHFTKNPDGSSFAMPDDSGTGCSAVVINDSTPASNWFGPEFRELSRLRGMLHETGHILDPEGEDVDELHPYRECAADAYFAIRMLQRFGQDAVPFLTMTSWARAHDAMMFSTSHLTTTVLDKIIADSAFHDNFANLSADETIKRATQYAKDWTPTEKALTEAIDVFDAAKKNAHRLRDIIEATCGSSGLALIVGAKVGDALVREEGVVYCGNHGQLPSEARTSFAETISTGLADLQVRSLFNTAAPRLASQPIVQPLRLPVGKPLVFNPA